MVPYSSAKRDDFELFISCCCFGVDFDLLVVFFFLLSDMLILARGAATVDVESVAILVVLEFDVSLFGFAEVVLSALLSLVGTLFFMAFPSPLAAVPL